MSYLLLASTPPWQRVSVTFDATATPIVVAGTILWTPPSPGFVRGLIASDSSGAPLVGGGGATTLSIGCDNAATVLVRANAFANYARGLGWADEGPLNSTPVGVADSGVLLFPVGTLPGRAAALRVLRGFANAGTVTGTLNLRFEFRPYGGGGF